MGNYFSSAPIDLGADQIARGYAGLANSISSIGNYFADQNRLKLQSALEEQKRKSAYEEQARQDAATYGVSPIANPDGSFNIYATMAATEKAKRAADLAHSAARARQANQIDLEGKADYYGVPVNPGQVADSAPTAAPFQAPAPLGPRVRQAEMAAKNAEYEQQRRIASDSATATATANRKAAQQDAFMAAMGREPLPTEYDPQGNLTAAALKALADAKAAGQLTPTQRNAKASVDTAIKAGLVKPEEADQAAAMFEANGGRAPKMPQSLSDAVDGDVRRLTGLRPLEDQVAKYDPGSFGPISFRTRLAAGSITGAGNDVPKPGEQPEVTARDIEQQYKKVSSGEAFAQGGKQLTKTELDAIISQVGKPTDADFPRRIQQYHDSVIRDAKVHLEQLEQSPYRYTAEGAAAIQRLRNIIDAGPTTAAPASQSGIKIKSVKQVSP